MNGELEGQLRLRPVTPDARDGVLETLTLAFADDPVWRPSLTRPDQDASAMREFWDIWLRGAMRYPHVWTLDQAAAVSVWIPPGGNEVSDEQFDELRELAHKPVVEVDILAPQQGRIAEQGLNLIRRDQHS